MSLFPDKGFVHKGPIHSSSDIGLNGRKLMNAAYPMGNSHGGMVCVNGQWYIFDHRTTNGVKKNRQAVAEPIEIQEDGTIQMVEATSCGLNGGPLKGIGTYPAYIACVLHHAGVFGIRNPMGGPEITQDGPDYEPPEPEGREVTVDTELTAPTAYISKMKNGSVAGFRYFDLEATTRIDVTVRGGGGVLELLPGEKGVVIASISIAAADKWTAAGTKFNAKRLALESRRPIGSCPLYFRYKGKGALDILNFTLA